MGCGLSCSVTAWHPEGSAHERFLGGRSPRAVRVWPIRPAARVGPDASGYRSSQGLAQDSCCLTDDTAARPDSAYEASSIAFELPDVHSLHPLRVTKTALEDEQAIRNLPLTELFVDSHFPPAESSLFTHRRPVPGRITWLRPHVRPLFRDGLRASAARQRGEPKRHRSGGPGRLLVPLFLCGSGPAARPHAPGGSPGAAAVRLGVQGRRALQPVALRPLGGGVRGRPAAHQRGQAHLLALQRPPRVLGCATREGLRQAARQLRGPGRRPGHGRHGGPDQRPGRTVRPAGRAGELVRVPAQGLGAWRLHHMLAKGRLVAGHSGRPQRAGVGPRLHRERGSPCAAEQRPRRLPTARAQPLGKRHRVDRRLERRGPPVVAGGRGDQETDGVASTRRRRVLDEVRGLLPRVRGGLHLHAGAGLRRRRHTREARRGARHSRRLGGRGQLGGIQKQPEFVQHQSAVPPLHQARSGRPGGRSGGGGVHGERGSGADAGAPAAQRVHHAEPPAHAPDRLRHISRARPVPAAAVRALRAHPGRGQLRGVHQLPRGVRPLRAAAGPLRHHPGHLRLALPWSVHDTRVREQPFPTQGAPLNGNGGAW